MLFIDDDRLLPSLSTVRVTGPSRYETDWVVVTLAPSDAAFWRSTKAWFENLMTGNGVVRYPGNRGRLSDKGYFSDWPMGMHSKPLSDDPPVLWVQCPGAWTYCCARKRT